MYSDRPEKIVTTIEARMTSSRLPGKVLLPIADMPALELLIRRLKKSEYLDGICVATTTNAADDPLIVLAEKLGVASFRGSESDVLGRVLDAARSQSADIIVEITGDCPFVDPRLIDRGIEEFFSHDVDYASNTIPATFPNGFDVQVFPTAILADVASRTDDPVDRTHVTYYMYMHQDQYRCFNWEAGADARAPEMRMTLDERSDYDAILRVGEYFKPQILDVSASEIVGYLRSHPEITAINEDVKQKEAYEL
jgi:spore coat polysaccharide biosynthesis protein SpsF